MKQANCRHCSESLELSRWEALNGFAVQCPSCGGYHGKDWNIRYTVLAGLVFNAFSFFFVLRPLRALGAFVLFGGAVALVLWLAVQYEHVDAFMIAGVGLLILGPVVINGIVLIRHQMKIESPPASRG